MNGDPVGAVGPLRRALRLASSNADAHERLGFVLFEVDRDECRAHLEAAMALEPGFEFPYISLVTYHLLRGEEERADELLDRARARGLGAVPLIDGRHALWLRDRQRAARALASLDPADPRHSDVAGWCRLVLHGVAPTAAAPLVPPGHVVPPFLRRFLLQTKAEVACYLGDLPRALAALTSLDAEQAHEIAWLERVPLLDELRAHPDAAPIRQRFAERAAAVVAAYAE
jgi:hypothetical protein